MPRQDGRLEPGQRLNGAISARAWNRMMDASDIVHGERYSIEGGSSPAVPKPYTWAYCKASVTVARWGVLAITGMEIVPTSLDSDDATKSFQDTPVLTGGTPSSSTTAWCVAVEPIESGKIGRVAVAGVVQLKAADLGKAAGARVLWKNDSWALVSIDGGVVLSKTSAAWNKGSSQTLTVYTGTAGSETASTGNSITAYNYVANLPSGVWVVLAKAGNVFYLASFDYTGLGNYSASKQQALTHDTSGVLAWVDTTACT